MASRPRPHLLRTVAAVVIAVAGMFVASLGEVRSDENRPLAIAGAALILVGGAAAVRSAARGLRTSIRSRADEGRAAAAGMVLSALGYTIVAFVLLDSLGVETQSLLLGGAVTGIAIGIAAQQTLGNFFAGMLLLVVRPFTIGERIVLRSGPLAGEYEGIVTDMSLFYVTMQTERGPVALPNAGVLAAAIGPGARAATTQARESEESGGKASPEAGPSETRSQN